MDEGEFNIGILNNINYFYNCAKDWFTSLVQDYEQSKDDETYTDSETGLPVGIPEYIQHPATPNQELSQETLTQNSAEQTTPLETPVKNNVSNPETLVKGNVSSPATSALTPEALKKKIAETIRLPTLKEDESSDEETNEKRAEEVISRASATNYSQSYSESIADLSNALSDMDTTALSDALNDANIDISKFLESGQSTKACQIIARIMFDEQFGSARDIVSRGKTNEQQMREIWGETITNQAKRDGSPCYLCTGKLVVPGGQAEMEHRMSCGEFYGRFAYIYSLYPKELAEWRYYVNKVADTEFKKKLEAYYDAINMPTINEDTLNIMYNNIINQFFKNSGIIIGGKQLNPRYREFANLLRAYLHEFAYAHHVCNQIKCNHDLGARNKNVDNYYSVLKQHLNRVQPKGYNPPWKHMQINSDFSEAENPKIQDGLKNTNLNELKSRVVFQMELLKKFSQEIAYQSGQTQNRMILRILKDALINMKDKKGPTDPSKRINEQAKLLAEGKNFYNNDITDAVEFDKDFNPPSETPRDDNWSEKLFNNRLPRFLERIEIILNNTNTYQGGPNTLDIISKCLKSPNLPDNIRRKILFKLKSYIDVLTKINRKVDTILNYTDLFGREVWIGVQNYLNNYLDKLNTLSKVKRTTQVIPVGQRKTGANSANTNTFASQNQTATNRKGTSGVANSPKLKVARLNTEMEVVEENTRNAVGLKRRRPASRKLTDAELEILKAKKEEERSQEVIQQNRARTERVDRPNRAQSDKQKIDGGRRRQIRTMRKIKGRPRKATMRVGRRKRTMKRKHVSRKNTRRRR